MIEGVTEGVAEVSTRESLSADQLDMLRAMDIQVWCSRATSSPSESVPAAVHESPRQSSSPQSSSPQSSSQLLPDSYEETAKPPDTSGVDSPHPEPVAAKLSGATASSIAQADWPTLQVAVAACENCDLHKSRSQTVFGVGNRSADWMIIGEAPGAEEDRRGEPFVGRAGMLLNEMLRAVGLAREDVYIANILKCHPPGNRDPHVDEAAACAAYLQRQIEMIAPKIILAVGRIAAQNLLQQDQPVGQLRGTVHTYGPAAIPLVVTYHPAYLLRSPGQKRKAWADLCLARSATGSS